MKRVIAAALLAVMAFLWGLRVGYETTRPWEMTDYGTYDAAMLSEVVDSLNERILDLEERRARAQNALWDKLTG